MNELALGYDVIGVSSYFGFKAMLCMFLIIFTLQLSGAAPPPLCRNAQPNGPNMRAYGAESTPRVTVNSTIAGPRRKFVDEGKLRKVKCFLDFSATTRCSLNYLMFPLNSTALKVILYLLLAIVTTLPVVSTLNLGICLTIFFFFLIFNTCFLLFVH